jgi:uncharacterized glyoxalase superfamily protein PhnB
MTFASMRPLLMVRNLKESIDFYADVLGFTVNATWPEEDPYWASLSAGAASLMLNYVGDPHAHEDGEEPHSHEPEFNGLLYFEPSGSLEELHARIRASVPSCGEIEVQPYGMKEFSVTDPNGYHLTFGVSTG